MVNSRMQVGWLTIVKLMPLEPDVSYDTLRDGPRQAFTAPRPTLLTVNTNSADVPDSVRVTFAIFSFSESPIRAN
jgi:hypothetical protein